MIKAQRADNYNVLSHLGIVRHSQGDNAHKNLILKESKGYKGGQATVMSSLAGQGPYFQTDTAAAAEVPLVDRTPGR